MTLSLPRGKHAM